MLESGRDCIRIRIYIKRIADYHQVTRTIQSGRDTMAKRMTIRFEAFELSAELEETPTGGAIAAALPLTGIANRWGDEIYFTIPVDLPTEPESREVVNAGELGYWPTGNAFCIFFGPTPVSEGDEIRAASPVNVFGRVEGDLEPLFSVQTGAMVELELID